MGWKNGWIKHQGIIHHHWPSLTIILPCLDLPLLSMNDSYSYHPWFSSCTTPYLQLLLTSCGKDDPIFCKNGSCSVAYYNHPVLYRISSILPCSIFRSVASLGHPMWYSIDSRIILQLSSWNSNHDRFSVGPSPRNVFFLVKSTANSYNWWLKQGFPRSNFPATNPVTLWTTPFGQTIYPNQPTQPTVWTPPPLLAAWCSTLATRRSRSPNCSHLHLRGQWWTER